LKLTKLYSVPSPFKESIGVIKSRNIESWLNYYWHYMYIFSWFYRKTHLVIIF
jgi:hypothetical protein